MLPSSEEKLSPCFRAVASCASLATAKQRACRLLASGYSDCGTLVRFSGKRGSAADSGDGATKAAFFSHCGRPNKIFFLRRRFPPILVALPPRRGG